MAGCEISRRASARWYRLERNEWSVHFNVSPDGTLFAGDGGDRAVVAPRADGQWIYLFTPGPAGLTASRSSTLRARLQPGAQRDVHARWPLVVFRSNMHGRPHVYAVELVKPPRPRRGPCGIPVAGASETVMRSAGGIVPR